MKRRPGPERDPFPKGFLVNGIRTGISRKKDKKDLAVFCSAQPAAAAGLFTANRVKAAPVTVSAKHLETADGVSAIVANAGCANACTGYQGMRDAEAMCALTAAALGAGPEQVLVASTGVIGQYLPMDRVKKGIPKILKTVAAGVNDPAAAAEAVMTTDTFPKTASRRVRIGGREVTVWGCAKGAGMIHPDLRALHATMLSFILTDAAVDREVLRDVLRAAADDTFNCVSVDGDTSTNDTLLLLANGAAGNAAIRGAGTTAYKTFARAVSEVCLELAKQIARDGEGATRLVEVVVKNAASVEDARKIAATIATSPLVKTAVFGLDANWGRVIAAAGRAGVAFDPDIVDIYLGDLNVARHGMAANFSEARAKSILRKKEVVFTLDLRVGKASARYYTCDFSFDYVKINASYRT